MKRLKLDFRPVFSFQQNHAACSMPMRSLRHHFNARANNIIIFKAL